MAAPLLHELHPALSQSVRHVALGESPTPVRLLPALSDAAGCPVWLKDDGAFGSGPWGGNKVRKLEWILPEARRRGARTLLTVGGLGTNWGLAAALYGREHGLRTAIALLDQPMDDHVRDQLGRLEQSGATLYRTRTKARTVAAMPWLLMRHSGRRAPYILPAGGSTPVGVLGYVEAALEIARQVGEGVLPRPSHVVTAMGSGGTAAGLALGLRLAGVPTRVVGVPVADQLRLDAATVARLASRAARLLERRGAALVASPPSAADVTVLDGWIGPGYGYPTPEAEAAAALAQESEGLDLDPVYTSKAFAALLAEARSGRFGRGPVLFMQTHGPRP